MAGLTFSELPLLQEGHGQSIWYQCNRRYRAARKL